MNDKKNLINKINKLKKEKKAIVLAHCYQNVEIDEVADFVGDSLFLSQQAAATDAEVIIFAGVYFMAETAKILSPNKKVLLPKLDAGCLMADMINLQELKKFKLQNPDVPTVCYINSTATVKSESDICCTSANAVEIVKSLNVSEVLFLPDTYLGSYIQSKLENVKVTSYPGYCPTHMSISSDNIIELKTQYPNAVVFAHPECHQDVTKLADFVGSTTAIMKNARESKEKTFIIATDKGVVDRLQRDLQNKQFILATPKAVCANMKKIFLEDILHSLEFAKYEINVPEKIAQKAYQPIQRMLQV